MGSAKSPASDADQTFNVGDVSLVPDAACAPEWAVDRVLRLVSTAVVDRRASEAEATFHAICRLFADELECCIYQGVIGADLTALERKRGSFAEVEGWTPAELIFDPRETEERQAIGRAFTKSGLHVNDPGTQALVSAAGTDRVLLFREVFGQPNAAVPAGELLRMLGVHDRLVVAGPIAPRREIYLILDRHREQTFTHEDAAIARSFLSVLKPVARHLARLWGWVDADETLTTRERDILHLLLQGLSEQEVADALGMKRSSTHQVVVRIFRKFDVTSRSRLMALWL